LWTSDFRLQISDFGLPDFGLRISTMLKPDVILIGAGHNGLVTAAYLAQSGLTVLVLERRSVIGGACVTEELIPGHYVSTAAYVCSLLDPVVIRDLALHRFGYAILPKDPASFTPLPDGGSLFIWQDAGQTHDEIAKFSAEDARHYPIYEALIDRMAALAESQFRETPANLPPKTWKDLRSLLSLGRGWLGLGGQGATQFMKVLRSSVASFLDNHFASDVLKATLATDGVIGFNGGPSTPGSAYVLLHHCMGEVAGKRGLWGFVRGGMGGVTQALEMSAKARGVVVRTRAPVARIKVASGQVAGVLLDDGEEIDAPIVVSNADPKRTFLRLIEARELPEHFRAGIEKMSMGGNVLKINLILGELPNFKACPGLEAGPQHRGTIHICPGMDYMEAAWREAANGIPSTNPMLECCIPTTYDDSLAPAGRHIMSIFVQYAPYQLRDGSWEAIGESYADRVIATLSDYAPNIQQAIIHRQVLTPLDLEREFGLTHGNIFHGDMTLSQLSSLRPMRGWAQYRTPIRNLYLCGSGTHPGGGVTGLPGYNAAREIISDVLKRKG
jgi:phytoene dehydrogenase-like protein